MDLNMDLDLDMKVHLQNLLEETKLLGACLAQKSFLRVAGSQNEACFWQPPSC